jgi:crotonobetainyl-CoA:carnitine CoA-transferase CaiB-like acyl-CoA transferase
VTTARDQGTGQRAVAAWAASGAMALTGPADGPPLGPPAPLVDRLGAVGELLTLRSTELGTTVALDPLALLGERAAIADLRRRGRISCGGGTRLLRTDDGWLALSLVRPEDVELVPAWLGIDPLEEHADPWTAVTGAVRAHSRSTLEEQAALLGLPVGALPGRSSEPPRGPPTTLPCGSTQLTEGSPIGCLGDVVVADLGSLWAGPLCGSLLAGAGANVLKVESVRRPDGARQGPKAFFDLLNTGKRSVALDFTADGGRRTLRALLERADVVIDASRPRALEQLGIDARAMITGCGTKVWLSITAHGRSGAGRDRVGFGDDAAVAGGLVAWDGDEPCFCADAVADPASGVVAATAVLDALAAGGTWLVDVALSRVAAHLAGPTLPVSEGVAVAPPRARRPAASGPASGSDTAGVLLELGVDA